MSFKIVGNDPLGPGFEIDLGKCFFYLDDLKDDDWIGIKHSLIKNSVQLADYMVREGICQIESKFKR